MQEVKVLAFDVFGTVVDWHRSIAQEVDRLALGVDGSEFARSWRAGYQPAMTRVRAGELGWTIIDDLHRLILDELLVKYGIDWLSEAEKRELNKVWHRLDPWPDAVAGLVELKRRYMICTLSNGNIGLLANMAKHAGLPWDCILSAETFQRYKPDPATYVGVARVFDVEPGQVLMVAAHDNDLAAARRCGLQTAYIERPLESGSDAPKDVSGQPEDTFHARDFLHLAALLAATESADEPL